MIKHRLHALILALLLTAPLAARAADLVVWWNEGFYEQEDEAVREIVAAFENETGKVVELVQPTLEESSERVNDALERGQPPDFFFPLLAVNWIPRWAWQGDLADLEKMLGPTLDLFDRDAVDNATMLNGATGGSGVYALPMGRGSNHVHVWKSLLNEAGLTLEDIPDEWDAFWSFWCDEVQPAVREALGRDDIWGAGLPMSAKGSDTVDELFQFQLAHEAPWYTPDGRLRVDDPDMRAGMIEGLKEYTSIWQRGCTPPDATDWGNIGNNEAFLQQRVVMTINTSLSIPIALRSSRPVDYAEHAVTIDWPKGAHGQPLHLLGFFAQAVVFEAGVNPPLAGEFVRFLVEDGWLAHWLTFAGDRFLPPMQKLLDKPFWLDPDDPHRMRAAIQILSKPHHYESRVGEKSWQSSRIWDENVWGEAVHSVALGGTTPEQAVDEAIARVKEILAE